MEELLVDTNWAFVIQEWILKVFYKEGIAVFAVFCIMTFTMASMLAYWAMRTGQFKDIESVKYEI